MLPARAGLLVFGLFALAMAMSAPEVLALWEQWRRSYTYGHGPLMVAISLWLVWRARDALSFESGTSRAGMALLLALEGAWVAARGAHVEVLGAALLPAIWLAAILTGLGPRAARRVAVPVALLWSAVPIWDVLAGPLQRITADASHGLLALVGVASVREGTLVRVSAGVFEVAAACSGLNFLVVAVTVAVIYAHVEGFRFVRATVLCAAAALVAMAANWLRVAIIIFEGERTHMQSPLVTEGHYTFGWWLFAAFLAVFFVVAARFRLPEGAASSPIPSVSAGRVEVPRRIGWVVALLLLGPGIAAATDYRWTQAHWAARPLPAQIGGWVASAAPTDGWAPGFASPTAEQRAQYSRDGQAVALVLTSYADERRGAKLVGYPSDPAGGAGSTLLSRGIAPGVGPVSELNDLVVRTPSGQLWRVWQWYQVGATPVLRPRDVKLRQGLGGFWGRQGAGAVSVATRCVSDCGGRQESERLAEFLKDAVEPLRKAAAGGGAGP